LNCIVANIMCSKAEFEKILKDLKISKNLKGADWPIVKNHVSARRLREGKESEVYLHGVLIQMRKIRKEALRHSNSTMHMSGGKTVFFIMS
jgi:hypothetical protein